MSNQNTIKELVEFVRTSIEFHPKLVELCVLAEKQQDELARVTAEREEFKVDLSRALDNAAALRARVADLETDKKYYFARMVEEENRANKAEQRNAELVRALREVLNSPESIISGRLYTRTLRALDRAESPTCQNATNEGQISSESDALHDNELPGMWEPSDFDGGLTDSESATPAKEAPTYFVPPEQLLPAYRGDMPAKHPDTERLDWLEKQFGDCIYWDRVFTAAIHPYQLRSTIDAARKQEGSDHE